MSNPENFTEVFVDVESGNVEEKVQALINEHPVLMFSKSTCPFCFELKRTLSTMGVEYAVVEVDKSPAMAKIQAKLGEISKITTVPNLFINQKSYGGCVDVKARLFHGKMDVLLAPFRTKTPAKDDKITRHTLFHFPETANGHVVRVSGLLTAIYAILCCIFYRHMATQWCVLALACDFALRLVYGASYSIVGMVAVVLTSRLAPKFVAGPPKQFAALCGLFFSTFGAGLFLGGQRVGGCIVIALLAGAASLEGVFDFCLGCWMFGLMIRFGLISPSVYRPYLSLREEKIFAFNFMHLYRELPPAKENETLVLPESKEYPSFLPSPNDADLKRKKRLELEYKLQDIDVIRHTTVEFFSIPMSIVMLAYMFQLTSERTSKLNFGSGYAGQVLAIVSVVIGGLLLIVYGMKAVMYPKKICKEYHHPFLGNTFATMTISVMLYGLFLLQINYSGGIALIWIGAIGHMLFTVLKTSDLLYTRWSEEYVTPGMMMVPVGNYLAALGFGTFGQTYPHGPNFSENVNYSQLARMWFAVAVLFTFVYFTLTLRRMFHHPHQDTRHRTLLWVYLATFAGMGPAYLACYEDAASVAASAGSDILFQSMYHIALFFFVVLSVGYVRGFFSYNNDLSMWIVPFALTVFAVNTIQYYLYVSDTLFLGMSVIAGAIACFAQAGAALHTLYLALDNTLFLPKPKWGPVSFMKLTHEAFRFFLPHMQQRIADIHALAATAKETNTNETQQDTVTTLMRVTDTLVQDLKAFLVVFDEHSKHEDDVLFPMMRRYFPGVNPSVDQDHATLHDTVHRWTTLVQNYETAKNSFAETRNVVNSAGENPETRSFSEHIATLVNALQTDFPQWATLTLDHLRNEEESITVIARKYVPLELQKQVTRECFVDVTRKAEAWGVIFHFMMYQLPVFQWKVRYLKTFLWAMPERSQEIGLMVYRNVDSGLWLALTQELPELVPRGVAGHVRMY